MIVRRTATSETVGSASHERVLTPHSWLAAPGRFLSELARDLWEGRHLAAELVRRDIQARYRQSFLGIGQAFFPPLATVAWCVLIEHARVINLPELDVPYPAFVLLSMMLWLTFTDALSQPVWGLVSELRVISRANFPAEALMLSKFGDVLFQFLVKLVLIGAGVAWFRLPIAGTVWMCPILVLWLVMLGGGLGLILAPFNCLYRDIAFALAPITTFWIFVTPVLFPMPATGAYGLIARLNPVSPLLGATRELATTGQLSDPVGLAIMMVLAPIIFATGWVFFRATLPVIIERTNA